MVTSAKPNALVAVFSKEAALHSEGPFRNKQDSGIYMPRSLVFLLILLAVIIGAMFFLSSMDVEQDLKPVEKPVVVGETK